MFERGFNYGDDFVNGRFFDAIGFSKESVMTWGFRTYHDEYAVWYVSMNDAREFCAAIGADPVAVEI